MLFPSTVVHEKDLQKTIDKRKQNGILGFFQYPGCRDLQSKQSAYRKRVFSRGIREDLMLAILED
jgi:hypothetical protein